MKKGLKIIYKWIVDWIKDVKIFKKISIKFENPVYPDDEIMFLGTISNIDNSGIEKIIICNYQGKKSKDIEVMNGTIELKIISND